MGDYFRIGGTEEKIGGGLGEGGRKIDSQKKGRPQPAPGGSDLRVGTAVDRDSRNLGRLKSSGGNFTKPKGENPF